MSAEHMIVSCDVLSPIVAWKHRIQLWLIDVIEFSGLLACCVIDMAFLVSKTHPVSQRLKKITIFSHQTL